MSNGIFKFVQINMKHLLYKISNTFLFLFSSKTRIELQVKLSVYPRNIICSSLNSLKVSKGAKIRSRYNQVPHPTQDTNKKVTNSQLDTTNESQEVSPFPAGDHKAHIYKQTRTKT